MPLRIAVAAFLLASLALMAARTRRRAREAERANPPLGRFIEADGVRLHYVERGHGPPLVVLHGNGSMVQELLLSDFVRLATRHYRVFIFDRPGYGYSDRPPGRVYTPGEQARLIDQALQTLGVERPLVMGHSWGALVAVALALLRPQAVRGLVLESGYFVPSLRFDVLLASGLAIPILGGLLRYTLAPPLTRLLWPHLRRRLFRPAAVPDEFLMFPVSMALRPAHMRASAAESALMIPSAITLSRQYRRLSVPVALVAGSGDRMVDVVSQSAVLAQEIPGSMLVVVPGCGHMVHHISASAIMKAVADVHRRSEP